MKVVEVPVDAIKVRVRLRTPSDEKVEGLAESIRDIGTLINPITIDGNYNLIAGYHRLLAFQTLGKETIPAIIQEESNDTFNELLEIDENLLRNELDYIEEADHLVRREELMASLGTIYRTGDNQHTSGESKVSVEELASGVGLSKRSYQQRKQIYKLHPEVKSFLSGTEFAKSLVDLIKLSSEEDHIQIEIANLLITGECRTWKQSFFQAKMKDHKLKTTPQVDFNIKERWGGMPKSLMKFPRVEDDLRKVCNLVNHTEDLRHTKATLAFGDMPIRLHQQNPDQARFSIDYYTRPGHLVCDPFNGRATTAITALHLQRRFVGFEINALSARKTREVITTHMEVEDSSWTLYEECGVEMESLRNESGILDAIYTSPPYFNFAESYDTEDERDLSNMPLPKFLEKIDILFGNISRLIKTSNYKERVFKPIIMTLGTARDGENGILDMSYHFQTIAKSHGLTLWDQMFVEVNNPFAWSSHQTNYNLGFVTKNYETQVAWVKFN